MKPPQPSKVLPFFYTTLLLFVIYLKFCLIRAEESHNTGEDSNKRDAELVVASQKADSETGTKVGDEPKKQVRRLVEIEDEVAVVRKDGPRVKQDNYFFYNSQPPSGPSYYGPRPRPRPLPFRQDPYEYDYDNYYQRPLPPPPYPPPPYQNPYQPYPYPYPIFPTVAPTASPTTTTTSSLKPIGYMLIDTYHTRAGSYSKPIAFFKT